MKEAVQKSERHLGIELLRITATGMIVLHHLLTHGGLLSAFPSPGLTDAAMRLLNAIVYCAVNLYGLISGYGSSGRFRPGRLVGLWLQVWFTGVALTAFTGLWTPLTGADWRTALLPICSQEYWYLTAYFGLYLLMPALHVLLEWLTRRQLTLTLLGCGLLFTLMPSSAEALSLHGGYHVGWLCVLYLLGGWLRRYGAPARTCWKPLLLAFLCMAVAWGWQMAVLLLKARGAALSLDGEQLLHYTSPVMLAASLALFVCFLRFQPKGRLERWIRRVAPLTLGVYLIHDQPMIRRAFLTMRLAGLSGLPTLLLFPALLGIWLAVFAGAAALEWLRIRLFALCRAERLCQWAGDRLTALARLLLPEEKAHP